MHETTPPPTDIRTETAPPPTPPDFKRAVDHLDEIDVGAGLIVETIHDMREDGIQATYEHAQKKAGGWEAILAGQQPTQHALERAFRRFFDRPVRHQAPPEVLYNALASSVGYAGSGLGRAPSEAAFGFAGPPSAENRRATRPLVVLAALYEGLVENHGFDQDWTQQLTPKQVDVLREVVEIAVRDSGISQKKEERRGADKQDDIHGIIAVLAEELRQKLAIANQSSAVVEGHAVDR